MLARSAEEENIQKLLAEKEIIHPRLLQAIAYYKQKFKPLEDEQKQPGNGDTYSRFLEHVSANSNTIDEFLKIDIKFKEILAQEKIVVNQLIVLNKAREALKDAIEKKATNTVLDTKSAVMDVESDKLITEWEILKSKLPIPACEAFKSKLQTIVTEMTSIIPVAGVNDFSAFQNHMRNIYTLMLEEIEIYCTLAKKTKSLLNRIQEQRKAINTACRDLCGKEAERHRKNATNAHIAQYDIMISGLNQIVVHEKRIIDIEEKEGANGLRKLISDLPPLPAAYETKRQFILREINNFTSLHTDKRSVPDLLNKITPVLNELKQFVNPNSPEYAQIQGYMRPIEAKEENVKSTTANIHAQLSTPPRRYSPPSETRLGDSSHRHSPPSSNESSPLTQTKGNGKTSQISVVPYSLHQPAVQAPVAQANQAVDHSNDQTTCACSIM